jgi:hypothetical protein
VLPVKPALLYTITCLPKTFDYCIAPVVFDTILIIATNIAVVTGKGLRHDKNVDNSQAHTHPDIAKDMVE